MDDPQGTEEDFGLGLHSEPSQGPGGLSRLGKGDKAVVVMIAHVPSSPVPPCDQLMTEARVTVPAVLNMLLFRSSALAVVYFGKQFIAGKKTGIDCADDLKFRMLRFLMSEIWPPLLRTDIPDESSPALSGVASRVDKDWLRSSIAKGMQVLVYLKAAAGGGKYLKLILTNPHRRIHFDITNSREEKHRWDNRMLHVRMLDNLETQKAVSSYDTYEYFFNEACKLSQTLSATAPESDELVPMVIRQKSEQSYRYFERLEKPESTTLDYKSYFSNPVEEIEHKSVKFMCGFLNALGMGKIVVGVYEMPRGPNNSPSSTLPMTPSQQQLSIDTLGGSSNTIVTHNMMVEQIVVGVSITDDDMGHLRASLSSQLQDCLPPIPPSAVKIESIPVLLPTTRLEPAHIFLLHDTQISGARDSFRQKSNFAIRQLGRSNLSICPLELEQYPELATLLPRNTVISQIYAIVPCDKQSEELLKQENWAEDLLLNGLDRARGRTSHEVVTYGPGITLPELRVVEISVALQDCPQVYQDYKGKFFCGWPSIPLWDPVTSTVRRVERNYNIRSGVPQTQARFPAWLQQHQVLTTIVDYLCGQSAEDLGALLTLRRVHSTLNGEHESRLGTELVTLLQRTPPGTAAVVQMSGQAISGMQSFLKSSQLSLMPLLLCRVYSTLGTLPSPFPYVAVPLPYQAMRVNAGLIPIYYLHTPHMGVLRLAVVLDSADGILKTIRWKDNGQKVVQMVMGIGFDRIDAISQQYFRPQRRASTAVPSSGPQPLSPNRASSPPLPSKLVKFSFLSGFHDSHFHGEPWTLRHLLIWLRLSVHDHHVQALSFAENSFGFCCDLHEICAAHFAEAKSSRPETPECFATPVSTIYPSSFDCAMHRAMAEWSHFCS